VAEKYTHGLAREILAEARSSASRVLGVGLVCRSSSRFHRCQEGTNETTQTMARQHPPGRRSLVLEEAGPRAPVREGAAVDRHDREAGTLWSALKHADNILKEKAR